MRLEPIYIIINVKEMDRAVRFYTEVLGLKTVGTPTGGVTDLSGGTIRIGLHSYDPSQAAKEGSIELVLSASERIEDVEDSLSRAGAKIVASTYEFPRQGHAYGKVLTFQDTEGNTLHVFEPIRR
jgi:predicted enzyme related to lactoylglutathione lyase